MTLHAVHQFLPTLSGGDATGNFARALRSLLRGWGFESEIFAARVDADAAGEGRDVATYAPQGPGAAILFHHGIETPLVDRLGELPERKAVVYHNVTPARFFRRIDPDAANSLDAAREQLPRLAKKVERAFALSPFSAEELRAAGFARVHDLPLTLDWTALDVPPDPAFLRALSDGRTNLLFVGRVLPHKRVDDLIRLTAAYRARYADGVRLVVAGDFARDTPWAAQSVALADRIAPGAVHFAGKVTPAELSACYAAAHVYVSMSEHEGVGLPLVEAMHRGVPVVAFGAGGVPWTVGDGGVLVHRKDFADIAGIAHVLARESELRRRAVEAGRQRVAAWDARSAPGRMREALAPLLDPARRLTAVPAPGPSRPQVAVVVQRYGAEVNGGAEVFARRLAPRLAAFCEVRVLTTCARDHLTWRNEFPPGEEVIEGVRVIRYSVDAPADPAALARARAHTALQQEEWIDLQGPYSSALVTAVRCADEVDLFLFLTCLYHPTVRGVPLVASRAVLVPTAHDEPMLRFEPVKRAFRAARAIVFLSEEERGLVERVIPDAAADRHVVGLGIEAPPGVSGERFRARHGLDRYFVYVGRVEPAKYGELFEGYRVFRARTRTAPDLVVAGRAPEPLTDELGVRHLGFLPEDQKNDAIAGAVALVMPSRLESFSIATLEAMALGVPVVASADGEVVAGHCRRSGAGLVYGGAAELAVALERLARDADLCQRLGARGPAYVRENYDWPRVEEFYRECVSRYARPKEDRRAYGT